MDSNRTVEDFYQAHPDWSPAPPTGSPAVPPAREARPTGGVRPAIRCLARRLGRLAQRGAMGYTLRPARRVTLPRSRWRWSVDRLVIDLVVQRIVTVFHGARDGGGPTTFDKKIGMDERQRQNEASLKKLREKYGINQQTLEHVLRSGDITPLTRSLLSSNG